jgi:hypothetical protein
MKVHRWSIVMPLALASLYHYKARVYDPRIGRFLQTDPAPHLLRTAISGESAP